MPPEHRCAHLGCLRHAPFGQGKLWYCREHLPPNYWSGRDRDKQRGR